MAKWFILISILIASFNLSAQPVGEEELFEVEEAAEDYIDAIPMEEPYYEEMEDIVMDEPPPPPPPPRPRNEPDNDRFQVDRREPPSQRRERFGNRASGGNAGGSSSFGRKSGNEIEFELVNPPQYWVGEKKPDIPKKPWKK